MLYEANGCTALHHAGADQLTQGFGGTRQAVANGLAQCATTMQGRHEDVDCVLVRRGAELEILECVSPTTAVGMIRPEGPRSWSPAPTMSAAAQSSTLPDWCWHQGHPHDSSNHKG
jgi:hypothetical protein